MNISIILAAGEGTRMKSEHAKVMHKVCGLPMLEHVLDASSKAGIEKNVVVVGHKKEEIMESFAKEGIVFAEQPIHDGAPYGTGYAVMMAMPHVESKATILVLCGDTPLIEPEVLKSLIEHHESGRFSATVLTAFLDNPDGYGRIIRNESGLLSKIVEQKDASEEERRTNEINAGIYCFDSDALRDALDSLTNDNSQGEYYLTDAVGFLVQEGLSIGAVAAKESTSILGVNSRVQLAEAEKHMRDRINSQHMAQGVTMINPDIVYIDAGVEIGKDSIIHPGVVLKGSTVIGENCEIIGNTRIVDSIVKDNVSIDSSLIECSEVGSESHIGPFAHLRPGSVLGSCVKIGNFVEVKNSTMLDGSKASHLSYIGDAYVGKNVNIGCGVVFVNYNGVYKSKTIVGDNAFIGSNSNLIAPLTVEDWGYVAAGSTITDDVKEGDLSIARARQVNKEGWVDKKGFKKQK